MKNLRDKVAVITGAGGGVGSALATRLADKGCHLALVDISELDGWEARAAWDDFKLGQKHGSEFESIAIVGSQRWLDAAAKVGSWFMSGEIKSFDNVGDARGWLNT